MSIILWLPKREAGSLIESCVLIGNFGGQDEPIFLDPDYNRAKGLTDVFTRLK